MTKYKQCGHESDGIVILDSNELSMAGWIEWSESVGVFGSREFCWDCFINSLVKTSDEKARNVGLEASTIQRVRNSSPEQDIHSHGDTALQVPHTPAI